MGTDISPPRGPGGTGPGGPGSREESEADDEQTSLDEYADKVEITDRQGEEIDERRQRLDDVLDEKLDVEDSQQFGSHTRGTMVGPLDQDSDTDIMVVLDEGQHGQWLREKNWGA